MIQTVYKLRVKLNQVCKAYLARNLAEILNELKSERYCFRVSSWRSNFVIRKTLILVDGIYSYLKTYTLFTYKNFDLVLASVKSKKSGRRFKENLHKTRKLSSIDILISEAIQRRIFSMEGKRKVTAKLWIVARHSISIKVNKHWQFVDTFCLLEQNRVEVNKNRMWRTNIKLFGN